MSQPVYYSGIITLTTSYVLYAFGFRAKNTTIIAAERTNDGNVNVSFDGTNLHNEVEAGENLNFTHRIGYAIWLKGSLPNQKCRVTAY